jgi:hypothetical protein
VHMAGRWKLALPLMVAVLMLLAASGSARRLGAGGSGCAGEATSGTAEHPIIQFLQRIYLQQLAGQPGSSCKTYDPNNPACHR